MADFLMSLPTFDLQLKSNQDYKKKWKLKLKDCLQNIGVLYPI